MRTKTKQRSKGAKGTGVSASPILTMVPGGKGDEAKEAKGTGVSASPILTMVRGGKGDEAKGTGVSASPILTMVPVKQVRMGSCVTRFCTI